METIETSLHPVKAWVDGVEFEDEARAQVAAMASLPFIHSHIAIMPDV
jgi:tRNA-splicing ligase RtcB